MLERLIQRPSRRELFMLSLGVIGGAIVGNRVVDEINSARFNPEGKFIVIEPGASAHAAFVEEPIVISGLLSDHKILELSADGIDIKVSPSDQEKIPVFRSPKLDQQSNPTFISRDKFKNKMTRPEDLVRLTRVMGGLIGVDIRFKDGGTFYSYPHWIHKATRNGKIYQGHPWYALVNHRGEYVGLDKNPVAPNESPYYIPSPCIDSSSVSRR